MQDISTHSWIFNAPKETYTNPALFLGIPNVEGTVAIYYGIPVPITSKRNKFKWVLYARKLRERRILKNGK